MAVEVADLNLAVLGQRVEDHLHGDTARIPSPHPELDVDLAVEGCCLQPLEGVAGRRVVSLREALPVRLVLRTDGVLPPPNVVIRATLARPGATWAELDWGGAGFDASGEVVTRARDTGRMKVHWMVEDERGSAWNLISVDVRPEQFVEVLDTPVEQVFEIEIPAAELERIARSPAFDARSPAGSMRRSWRVERWRRATAGRPYACAGS
jgi:hypothetical protein